jgi:predicted RNA-binding Zn-ribbon protein involved in translation (DUF1610 family)
MSKITEERFKDILLSLEIDYEQISILLNHPEIKILFESSEGKFVDKSCKMDMEMSEREHMYRCPSCMEKNVFGVEEGYDYCPYCGQKLIWPTEPPAPVAEYEVIKYFKDENGLLETICPHNMSGGGSNPQSTVGHNHSCCACTHFAGHELEGKSIRCKHKFNNQ